jgi:protein-arginine kinase activator protein McsA
MLCEKCHEREATCHSTTVIDGASSDISLCEECFASSAEPAVRECFAAAKTARCRYCGGVACSGGMDSPEISTGGHQQMIFLCLRCVGEYGRYWQQQLQQVPQDLPQQKQMAAIRALLDDADRHMRQWVLERGSR